MTNLRQTLATVIMLGLIATSTWALAPQKRGEEKPPPPKEQKLPEKTEKKDPPREDRGNKGGRGEKRGKP